MIELHERLSEYSYGYGVTREVERLLASVGLDAVPFLPSLLQEGELAFDVAFNRRGKPLLLQFKLGQSLNRFVRSNLSDPRPRLDRPFFRFRVDTAETDGQFETLLKSETDGAEVYYVAPRFADWAHYVDLFETEAVLENSVLIAPSEIRAALDSTGASDGRHRIVYDLARTHVCSKPVQIRETKASEFAERLARDIRVEPRPVKTVMRRVFAGLDDRSPIRRASRPEETDEGLFEPTLGQRMSPNRVRIERHLRLGILRERSRSEEDAIALALGLEFWGLGIQLLFAVDREAA